ncbi:MAG: mycofactocin biosynthesis peptidyl-dipeptidase MftE [Nakamurella sp.]
MPDKPVPDQPEPHRPEPELAPLAIATWPEVDRSARRLLILPLGSIEQHGPHLPLDTDTVIATHLAEQVHQRFPQVGLAPPMPYGASGEHRDFPGTLSIGTEALTAVLVEFVRHASTSWRQVLVINGHGGNAAALAHAAELLRIEGRSMTVQHAASGGERADPHAGYRETSLMLHLAPATVRAEMFEAGNTASLVELLPLLRTGGVRQVSGNGVLGDPTGANGEAGSRIFAAMVAAVIAQAGRLLSS